MSDRFVPENPSKATRVLPLRCHSWLCFLLAGSVLGCDAGGGTPSTTASGKRDAGSNSAGVRSTGTAGATGTTGTGGGSSSTGVGGRSAQGAGTMTAFVDGKMWSAEASTTRAKTEAKIPGGYTLEGTDMPGLSAGKITLSFYNIETKGTYPFGVDASVVGAYASYSLTSGETWHTAYTGDRGTLTITTLSAARIAGMFELELSAYPGTKATGTHSVTKGEFDMTWTGSATPIGPGLGRSLSAQLDGQPFNAASIVVTPLASGFSFNAINDNFNVGFSFSDVSAAGSYDLSFGAQSRTLIVVAGSTGDPKSNCCWGANPDDTGTLTLSTFSDDRFVGTFEVSLKPQASSAATAPLVFSSGKLDIGRK